MIIILKYIKFQFYNLSKRYVFVYREKANDSWRNKKKNRREQIQVLNRSKEYVTV